MQPHFLQDGGAAVAERRVTRGGFQAPPPADVMDSFHLPPLIEEALDSSDELCELKEENPALTAKEKESVEEKEETQGGGGEKGQREEEKEVTEEKDSAGGGVKKEEEDEEQEEEMEELRAQVFSLLLELDQTREDSQRHEESALELQGLLEEERLASAHQAESFSRHIQRLQAQLQSVQEEMSSLEQEKEAELQEVQEELRSAQEEVLLLQQAAEEAAAERENDIACLQEELCRLRAELQRLHAAASQSELEMSALRAEISGRGLQGHAPPPGEVSQLTVEEAGPLTEPQQQQQQQQQQQPPPDDRSPDAYLTVATGEGVASEGGCVSTAGPAQEELEVLRMQLRLAEETAQRVQRECDGVKVELLELQQMYDSSQRERQTLEEELRRCREQLQEVLGRKRQTCTRSPAPPVFSAPSIGMIVIVALIWCWWAELASY
ncbi:uncharacterized protein LOC142900017 isoform X2 [Nelusetta ayraudi]|uniref:uncharacterized protein LOC142900017 isoform X2 n=1 Tax=Nelusetta ayraudi TaxID=303726 RepID=UPI003F7185F0